MRRLRWLPGMFGVFVLTLLAGRQFTARPAQVHALGDPPRGTPRLLGQAPAGGAAPLARSANVLYDQYDHISTRGTASQKFESQYAPYDSETADDFVVPAGQAWAVTGVDVDGFVTPTLALPASFNVYLYANAGTLPGTLVYSALAANFTRPITGEFSITVPAASLPPGHYWLTVQANLVLQGGGQWYWTDRMATTTQPAAFENPGGGFGVCPNWTVRTMCAGDAGAPDQVFRLNGTVAGTPTAASTGTPTQTPTATPSSTPAATTTPCTGFSDVHMGDYFYAAVQYLAGRNIVSGYADCTFRPYANTTRSQMVKIVVNGFSLPSYTPASGYTFADVAPANPFWRVIEAAAHAGIVSGYNCGGPGEPCDPQSRAYFRPYANVTRGQLTKIVAGAAGWLELIGAPQTFTDVVPNSAFYVFVETAVCHGVISGYACGGPGEPCDPQGRAYFRQAISATRSQIAKIVDNALTGGPTCPAATATPPSTTPLPTTTPTVPPPSATPTSTVTLPGG